MNRTLLLILAVGTFDQLVNAQAHGTLDVNDVELRVSSAGRMGADQYGGMPTLVVPASGGSSTLYSAGLWMAGLSSDGQLKLAADLFGVGRDFFPGPLTVSGDASISPETSAQYDHVWTVNASDVERHRAYFDCLNDPDCNMDTTFPDGYSIPEEFISWPAEGDVTQDQASYLAPFVDYNVDGEYSATDGDHPCLPGDQALFAIFNDKLSTHTESYGQSIGVEIHMTPFAYTSDDPAIDQTVFIHYKVINRGTQQLNDFRMGIFMDPDLGCAADDFLGTDVARNMFYVYNWDDYDEDCFGGVGYGPQPPALGLVVLKGLRLDLDGLDNIDSPPVAAFNGSGFNDQILDNERSGLSNTMTWFRDGPYAVSDPSSPPNFHTYLRSHWKDGTPMTYGGTGYSIEPTSVPSLFVHPGESDPSGVGTNGTPQSPWAETTMAPIDRRGIATVGAYTLEPGDSNDILVAYVYARATTGGPLASVAALQQRVDSVAAFAETIPGLMANGTACDAVITSGIHDNTMGISTLTLYPVPATNTLTVHTPEMRPGTVLRIFDGRGSLVTQVPGTGTITTFDVAALAPGLYTVRTTGANTLRTGRFIKE